VKNQTGQSNISSSQLLSDARYDSLWIAEHPDGTRILESVDGNF